MNDSQHKELAFFELDLEPRLLSALDDMGFSSCTPIQSRSLPLLLRKQDVAGQAQTGTGKTAAYLLAILQLLLREAAVPGRDERDPVAVIIAPTRELAIQIHKDAEMLSRNIGIRISLVYGGIDYEHQRRQLDAGTDLLIGTPGRVIDYLKQRIFNFKRVSAVVLDEADRMFDLGFIRDIRYLLRRMPHPDKRLNMLFSATLSHRVLELAYEHMGDPVLIRIDPEQVTAEKVKQVLYHVGKEEKIALLLGLLKVGDPSRSIIFVNTRRMAEKLEGCLNNNAIRSALLSGDVPQKKRQRALQAFRKGEIAALVTTDVAARGLHIPDVSHVFNFDLPQNREDYVHRIGRTARAGASGDAISFACEEYVFSLPDIEEYIGHRIPVERVSNELLCEYEPVSSRERSRERGRGSAARFGRGDAGREGKGSGAGRQRSTARRNRARRPRPQ